MDQFQLIVIGVALFFLVIILIAVSFIMLNAKTKSAFPPVQEPCPNLWTTDGKGNCFFVGQNYGSAFVDANGKKVQYQYNGPKEYPVYSYYNNQWYGPQGTMIKKPDFIGNSIPSNVSSNYAVINTSDPKWSIKGLPLCSQKSFSNENGIYWDGVSNYNKC